MAANWGSVPDWVAAVGSTSALLGLLWEVRRRRRDEELRAAEDTVAAIRRQEAAEAQAWRVFVGRPEVLFAEPEGVFVINDSDDPVSDAVVTVWVLDPDPVRNCPPVGVRGVVPFLPARSRVRFPLGRIDLRYGLGGTRVWFTDVQGVRWVRDGVEPPVRGERLVP